MYRRSGVEWVAYRLSQELREMKTLVEDPEALGFSPRPESWNTRHLFGGTPYSPEDLSSPWRELLYLGDILLPLMEDQLMDLKPP